MRGDPFRRRVESDLWLIRRGIGPWGIHRLAHADDLIETVGAGTLSGAWSRLIDGLDRWGQDPEGPIRAYFESCGLETDGDSLNLRLARYAQGHHVTERTARRRSDRGAEELSFLLSDNFKHERPQGRLFVVRDGPWVSMAIGVSLPERSKWRVPQVWLNDERQNLEFELHAERDDWAGSYERLDHVALIEPQEADDSHVYLDLSIVWLTPVWATWTLRSLPGDGFLDVLRFGRGNSVEYLLLREPAAVTSVGLRHRFGQSQEHETSR